MRRLLLLLTLAAGLAVPLVAFGEGSPSPAAVAACRAEAAQLGNDAFVAKYGPTEPWGHCYAHHATTTTTTEPTEPAGTTTTTTVPPTTPSEPRQLCEKLHGKGLASCRTRLRAILAACESTATSRDAFKACVATAVDVSKRR